MSVNTSKIKAVWHWLVEVQYVWLCVISNSIALFISLLSKTEQVIRYTGLVLQLLGILAVIWGISETRALFGHPSFASKVKSWFSSFPLLNHPDNTLSLNGSFSLGSCKAREYSTHPPENTSTEARLEALEKNLTLIHERINQTQSEIDDEFQKSANELRNEQQIRETEDKKILDKLEKTGTGGVHISAIGASWLFFGVILSTAAIEIAELLK